MDARQLLLRETHRAYRADEMSLLSAVFPHKYVPPGELVPAPERNLADAQARAKPECWYQSIFDILKHVADCKAMYMHQAFGEQPDAPGEPGETLESVLAYLQATQDLVIGCLERIPTEDLPRPVPTKFHNESAAYLFWVLAQHDVAHGAQIEVIRDSLES